MQRVRVDRFAGFHIEQNHANCRRVVNPRLRRSFPIFSGNGLTTSEYGAAPKVEPGRWVGIKGVVQSNPFYDICRSQQDVRILGDWKRLLGEVRDSHWIMAYGDYLKELGYAAPRVGARWDQVSD